MKTYYFTVARGANRAADAALLQGIRRFEDEIAWLIEEDNFAHSVRGGEGQTGNGHGHGHGQRLAPNQNQMLRAQFFLAESESESARRVVYWFAFFFFPLFTVRLAGCNRTPCSFVRQQASVVWQ